MSVAHVSGTWIGITCLVLLGLGVLTAVKNERETNRSGLAPSPALRTACIALLERLHK